ncbi:MAG: hypothetical protein ACI4KF_07985 [Huintestinicola sp.]
MTKQTSTHTINIKQEPDTKALAEVIAMMIRAEKNGKEIFRNDTQADK